MVLRCFAGGNQLALALYRAIVEVGPTNAICVAVENAGCQVCVARRIPWTWPVPMSITRN